MSLFEARTQRYRDLYNKLQKRLDILRYHVAEAEKAYNFSFNQYNRLTDLLRWMLYLKQETTYIDGNLVTLQEVRNRRASYENDMRRLREFIERAYGTITAYENILAKVERMPERQAVVTLMNAVANIDWVINQIPLRRRIR